VYEAMKIRSGLIRKIRALNLPKNSLDRLLEMGNVAELTGRTKHMEYETRAFMDGRKLVSIISEAASVGISLHASAKAVNQRPRVHLTIELPWVAEQAIQQLGRSHRTNQLHPPQYILVTTELGGENRFITSVAKRLKSMGALTRGDRRASSTLDLEAPTGVYATRALKAMLLGIWRRSIPEEIWPQFGASKDEVLEEMKDPFCQITNLEPCGTWVYPLDQKAYETMTLERFLNRLLSLEYEPQQRVYSLFHAWYTRLVEVDTEAGVYSAGVQHLSYRFTRAEPPKVIHRNAGTGSCLMMHSLVRDRGVSYEDALEMDGHFYMKDGRPVLVVGERMVRPRTGWSGTWNGEGEAVEDVKIAWTKEYESGTCMHGEHCGCSVGRRKDPFLMLTGDAVGFWCVLDDLLKKWNENSTLTTVTVRVEDSEKLVGVVWPSSLIRKLEHALATKTHETKRMLKMVKYEGFWSRVGIPKPLYPENLSAHQQMQGWDFVVQNGVVTDVGNRAFTASLGRLKRGYRLVSRVTSTPASCLYTLQFEMRMTQEEQEEQERLAREGLKREDSREPLFRSHYM
jgi:hypothetical protein